MRLFLEYYAQFSAWQLAPNRLSVATVVVLEAIGFAIIWLSVLLCRKPLTYDEPYHLTGASTLIEGHSIRELLHTNLPSAPGPLYSVIHYALNPVTHLAPPAVRVPNLVFLLLTSFLVVLTLKKTGVAHPAPLGLALISLPIVWPCSGLALTEVPSLIMATAACFILTRVLTGTATSSRGVALLSALAGLCTSLAVLGRQTYLPLIALGLLPLSIRYGKKSLVPCVLYGGTASVLPGLVFVAWGGLVPPSQAHIKGFSPIHGITALAYLAACVLIVAPGYYRRLLRAQIIAAVAIAILNLCVLHFEWRALAGAFAFDPRPVASRLYAAYRFRSSGRRRNVPHSHHRQHAGASNRVPFLVFFAVGCHACLHSICNRPFVFVSIRCERIALCAVNDVPVLQTQSLGSVPRRNRCRLGRCIALVVSLLSRRV